jgi:hypothetical protein
MKRKRADSLDPIGSSSSSSSGYSLDGRDHLSLNHNMLLHHNHMPDLGDGSMSLGMGHGLPHMGVGASMNNIHHVPMAHHPLLTGMNMMHGSHGVHHAMPLMGDPNSGDHQYFDPNAGHIPIPPYLLLPGGGLGAGPMSHPDLYFSPGLSPLDLGNPNGSNSSSMHSTLNLGESDIHSNHGLVHNLGHSHHSPGHMQSPNQSHHSHHSHHESHHHSIHHHNHSHSSSNNAVNSSHQQMASVPALPTALSDHLNSSPPQGQKPKPSTAQRSADNAPSTVVCSNDLVARILSLTKAPTRPANRTVVNQAISAEKLPTAELFVVNVGALEDLRKLPCFWGCRFRIPGSYFARCNVSPTHTSMPHSLLHMGDRTRIRRKSTGITTPTHSSLGTKDLGMSTMDQQLFGSHLELSTTSMTGHGSSSLLNFHHADSFLPHDGSDHLSSHLFNQVYDALSGPTGDVTAAAIAVSSGDNMRTQQMTPGTDEVDIYNLLIIFFRVIARIFSTDKSFTNAKLKVITLQSLRSS